MTYIGFRTHRRIPTLKLHLTLVHRVQVHLSFANDFFGAGFIETMSTKQGNASKRFLGEEMARDAEVIDILILSCFLQ